MLILRKLLNLLGQPSNKEDIDDLLSQLRQAEEQVNDLKERLKTSTSNVEQYRAMVTSLEESLNKEKQVYTILKSVCMYFFFKLGCVRHCVKVWVQLALHLPHKSARYNKIITQNL